ncbi:uncharacterized protein ISCGN_009009 [Ixodes scapularis]
MSQLFLTTPLTTQANIQGDNLPSALSTGHPTYTTTDGGDPMELQAPSGSGNTVKRTYQDPMFQKDLEKLEEPTKKGGGSCASETAGWGGPYTGCNLHMELSTRHTTGDMPQVSPRRDGSGWESARATEEFDCDCFALSYLGEDEVACGGTPPHVRFLLPAYLTPVLLLGFENSKCVYCLLLPLLLWLLHSAPRPATALFHVVCLPLLDLMSPDQLAAQYFSMDVLVVLLLFALMLVTTLLTDLVPWLAYASCSRYGLRRRSLFLAVCLVAFLSAALYSDTIASVPLLFLVNRVFSVIYKQNLDLDRQGTAPRRPERVQQVKSPTAHVKGTTDGATGVSDAARERGVTTATVKGALEDGERPSFDDMQAIQRDTSQPNGKGESARATEEFDCDCFALSYLGEDEVACGGTPPHVRFLLPAYLTPVLLLGFENSKCVYCLLLPLLLWLLHSAPRPATALFHVVCLPLLDLMSPDQLAAQYFSVSERATPNEALQGTSASPRRGSSTSDVVDIFRGSSNRAVPPNIVCPRILTLRDIAARTRTQRNGRQPAQACNGPPLSKEEQEELRPILLRRTDVYNAFVLGPSLVTVLGSLCSLRVGPAGDSFRDMQAHQSPHGQMSASAWLVMTVPGSLLAAIVSGIYVYHSLIRPHQTEENFHEQGAIMINARRKLRGLEAPTMLSSLFICYTIFFIALYGRFVIEGLRIKEALLTGLTIGVVLGTVASHLSGVSHLAAAQIWSRLPWGIVITFGAVQVTSKVVEVSPTVPHQFMRYRLLPQYFVSDACNGPPLSKEEQEELRPILLRRTDVYNAFVLGPSLVTVLGSLCSLRVGPAGDSFRDMQAHQSPHGQMSASAWLVMTVPGSLLAAIVSGIYVYHSLIRPQMLSSLFICYTIFFIALYGRFVIEGLRIKEALLTGLTIGVVLGTVASHLSGVSHLAAAQIWSRLPWGIVITFGAVQVTSKVVERYDLLKALFKLLDSSFWETRSPIQVQIILTAISSVLAEAVDNRTLSRLMMPIVTHIATATDAPPMYYGIPVVVAASSNAVMPVSVTMVVLHELTRIPCLQLMSASAWLVMTVPGSLLAAIVSGIYVYHSLIRPHQTEENFHEQGAIMINARRKLRGLEAPTMLSSLFICYTIFFIALYGRFVIEGLRIKEALLTGLTIGVVLGTVASHLSGVSHLAAAQIWSRLPWGIVITFGAVQVTSKVVERYDLLKALFKLLDSSFWETRSPIQVQIILTAISSVLAEAVDNRTLSRLMMPIVTHIATATDAPPMYYGIPVVVAASSNAVMPVSVTMVVLHELTRIPCLQLPPLSSTTAKDAPTSQPTHERALGAPRKGIFKGPKMSTGAGPAKPTAALAHSIQAGIGGQAPATTTSYCMTSLPSTPVPASASDPKCSQQTPADMDHSYHNKQDNQTGHASLGKRPTDINGDSAELSMTFAEQQAAEVITMDHESTEGDLEGFILVQHRMQRTTGVPVLLTPSNETQRLQQLNPLMLSTDVNTAAGGPIIRHQFTARGGLLVEVAEVSSVNKLMQVQTLGGIPVQVTIPTTYLQNFGLIKGVPLWYTDAQLAEFLQSEGVVAARRHYRRRGKPGDAATPSDRVVLTFRSNTERPSKVNLGFTRHEVAEYIEAPPRCYNCQALGHIAKYCKQSPKCKREALLTGLTIGVVLGTVASHLSGVSHLAAAQIWSRLPWGIVITFGAVQVTSKVVERYDLLKALFKLLDSSFWETRSPIQVQIILTAISSVLAEAVDNRTLSRLMMPIVTHIATATDAPPMYYGIPVVVAASSNAVMPVSVTMVVLHELTRIPCLQLVLDAQSMAQCPIDPPITQEFLPPEKFPGRKSKRESVYTLRDWVPFPEDQPECRHLSHLGLLLPFSLTLVFSTRSQNAKCAYCLLIPLLLYATNAAPKPVAALLYIVNLPLLGLMSAELVASQYLCVSCVRCTPAGVKPIM